MKKNIFLEIEYLGTNYFGFQSLKKKRNQPTLQEAIENALLRLFKQNIKIVSSSRTDRGVHAKAHPLNFKADTSIPLKNLKRALNSLLPLDIRVKKVKEVPLEFQARFWAKSKIYRYIIFNQKEPSVFESNFSWHFPEKISISLMRKAARKVVGKRDFSIFAKGASKYRSCIRNLKNISVSRKGNFIFIDLEADGFLRQMARNIVFFLVAVGSGKIDFSDLDLILSREKKAAQKPAPSQGLYLCKVKY